MSKIAFFYFFSAQQFSAPMVAQDFYVYYTEHMYLVLQILSFGWKVLRNVLWVIVDSKYHGPPSSNLEWFKVLRFLWKV